MYHYDMMLVSNTLCFFNKGSYFCGYVDMQRDKQVSASNLIEIISDTEWVALLETWEWEMFDILWL